MVDLMLDLNRRPRAPFESNWRCTITWQRRCTWRFTWLKYEHFSVIGGAPDGSFKDTPTFEVEIKGVLEVTIELHSKMQMVVHLLVQKSSQNNSIKGDLEEAFYRVFQKKAAPCYFRSQKSFQINLNNFFSEM